MDTIHVIVISYNQEQYIEQCLKGILAQRVDGFVKIYVGDDASEDRTPEIIHAYKNMYPDKIFPVFRKINIGASANLGELIRKCDGEYIAFCEGDDYWIDNNKLQKQIDFLKSNPKYIGVVHDIILLNYLGKMEREWKLDWLSDRETYSLEDFDGRILPGHISSLCIRRIDRLKGSDLDILYADRNISDRSVFLIVLFHGDVYRLCEKMSVYRYLRKSKNQGVMAGVYKEKSRCFGDMVILNRMEKWLAVRGKRNGFVCSRSLVLVTAVYHTLKGYDEDLRKTFGICHHKKIVLFHLPAAVFHRMKMKIFLMLGFAKR